MRKRSLWTRTYAIIKPMKPNRKYLGRSQAARCTGSEAVDIRGFLLGKDLLQEIYDKKEVQASGFKGMGRPSDARQRWISWAGICRACAWRLCESWGDWAGCPGYGCPSCTV